MLFLCAMCTLAKSNPSNRACFIDGLFLCMPCVLLTKSPTQHSTDVSTHKSASLRLRSDTRPLSRKATLLTLCSTNTAWVLLLQSWLYCRPAHRQQVVQNRISRSPIIYIFCPSALRQHQFQTNTMLSPKHLRTKVCLYTDYSRLKQKSSCHLNSYTALPVYAQTTAVSRNNLVTTDQFMVTTENKSGQSPRNVL